MGWLIVRLGQLTHLWYWYCEWHRCCEMIDIEYGHFLSLRWIDLGRFFGAVDDSDMP